MRLGPTAIKILRLLANYPCTAREIMNAIRPEGCTSSWGNSYFLPANSGANGYHSSLRRRGLIEARGKTEKGATVWGLTPAGLYHMHRAAGLPTQVQCNPPRRSV
jgi:hypothetical protein